MYPFHVYRSMYERRRKKRRLITALIVLIIVSAGAVAVFLVKSGWFAKKDSVETINIYDMVPSLIEIERGIYSRENYWIREESPPPVKVKGLYITGWSAGNAGKIEHYIELCGTTEINALVIDIKEDRGNLTFISDISISRNSAAAVNMIRNPAETVSLLKSHGIYTIARIVCFKDPVYSAENPELAIKDKNGGLWTDKSGNTWLDPYKTGAWDYIIDIAKESAGLGFDEVQFDYIRFPTDGNINEIDYGSIAEEKTKAYVIGEFLEYAREKLKAENVYISADVFGIIAVSRLDSETIGQDLNIMARHADSICPMIYPSHYANKRQNGEGQNINGILFEAPDKQPYEVIYNTLLLIKERLADIDEDDCAAVRPYLQNFTAAYLGAGYYQEYTAKQLREQIQAVYDAGFEEWIFWNASNIYSEDAFLLE